MKNSDAADNINEFLQGIRSKLYHVFIAMKKSGIMSIGYEDDGTKLNNQLRSMVMIYIEDEFYENKINKLMTIEYFFQQVNIDSIVMTLHAVIGSTHAFWTGIPEHGGEINLRFYLYNSAIFKTQVTASIVVERKQDNDDLLIFDRKGNPVSLDRFDGSSL